MRREPVECLGVSAPVVMQRLTSGSNGDRFTRDGESGESSEEYDILFSCETCYSFGT